MTYDDVEIEFIETDRDDVKLAETESDYNALSLFSGGLDSLGGSYYVNEDDTLFLSIVSSGIKNGRVLDNLEEVRNIDLERIKIGRDVSYEENSQFSRSFLYLSMALSTALINGVNEVILPENGVVARQIGLNQGRKPTRTAHPKFIEYYEEFANELIEQNIEISNPLDKKTKSEVIDLIEDENCIPKAYSCSHTRFPFWADKEAGEKQHCGMGIPCLFRTVAIIGSNNLEVEDKLNLAFNPFTIDFADVNRSANVDEPDKQPVKTYFREGVSSVLEMTQFAYELLNSDREELIIEYPELADKEVYSMYQRFARNVKETAEYFSKDNAEKPISDKFQ